MKVFQKPKSAMSTVPSVTPKTLNLWQRLRRRTPLGWLQLKHTKGQFSDFGSRLCRYFDVNAIRISGSAVPKFSASS